MPTAASILVDGVARDTIDVRDRGLAFGDGLFETIAVVGDTIINGSDHYERLSAGCAQLDIPCPEPALLSSEILSVAANHLRSVVRVTLTRGLGGTGYTPPRRPAPTRIVARRPWPDHYAAKSVHGIRIGIAHHPLSINPGLAGLKHLNRLDQVLASREVDQAGWDEALMRSPDGRVIEATRCNVFAVLDDELVTPMLDTAGVRGVMRKNVLAVARSLDLTVRERTLYVADIARSQELLLCNAIIGIWPVIALHGEQACSWPIGPITTTLRELLERAGSFP